MQQRHQPACRLIPFHSPCIHLPRTARTGIAATRLACTGGKAHHRVQPPQSTQPPPLHAMCQGEGRTPMLSHTRGDDGAGTVRQAHFTKNDPQPYPRSMGSCSTGIQPAQPQGAMTTCCRVSMSPSVYSQVTFLMHTNHARCVKSQMRKSQGQRYPYGARRDTIWRAPLTRGQVTHVQSCMHMRPPAPCSASSGH